MVIHAAHTSYMFELASETEAVSHFSLWGYFSTCPDPFEVVPMSPFRSDAKENHDSLFFFSFGRLHFSPDHSTRYFLLIIKLYLPSLHLLVSAVKKCFTYLQHHIYAYFGFYSWFRSPRHFRFI